MKSLESTAQQILQFMRDNDHFLITAHMNADGDAYASCLAMAYVLTQWGKQFEIILHDERKENKYAYLWGWHLVQQYQDGMQKQFQAAIVLDVPSLRRIGAPAKYLPARDRCIKIDHHPLEDDFAHINLVSTEASSTSQLVYEVLSRGDIEFTDELATILFSGIMYDTGRFSFSNTSRRDFEIAAHLLQFNVKPHDIANKIFFNNSFDSMKVIGYGLANMESHLDGKLCIIFLPLSIMEKNEHSEIEELANYSVAISGVEVGVFIREVKPGYFKVSFRSKGRVSVNQVAKAFGGGGHEHAAGCRLQTSFQELKKNLIAEVDRHLKQLK